MESDLNIRVIRRWNEAHQIRDAWNALLNCSGGIDGPDVTMSYEWARAAWNALQPAESPLVIVLEQSGRPIGLLPMYASPYSVHGLKLCRVAPINELHSGRSGLLLDKYEPLHLETLLHAVAQEVPRWNLLFFTCVDGSRAEALWLIILSLYSVELSMAGVFRFPAKEVSLEFTSSQKKAGNCWKRDLSGIQ
jgi:hypothetical protein